jgi:chloride channel protein, CIC family
MLSFLRGARYMYRVLALYFMDRIARLYQLTWLSMMLWAVLAGFIGAMATELFRLSLYWGDLGLLGQGGSLVALARSLNPMLRLLVPTVGGILAGLILLWVGKFKAENSNTDYMEASTMGDGRIPVRETLGRSLSSMVSIVSGGSIGREGSMVQLAAMCASVLGQWLHMPADRLRLLVACGAAAGITAAYNAPFASTFFIAEIVLGSIALDSLGPIIVAAVVANITMREFPGYQPPYVIPSFPAIQGLEVLLFALLGILAGLASSVFLRGLEWSRKFFASLTIALPLRLGLGGLVVGLVSWFWPEVWGNGYSVVTEALHSHWSWSFLTLLLASKVLATFATVGSGAVGGVFTPALFFGCMLGEIYGLGVQALWPEMTSAPFAYGIVGMGAFLAGSTQAPLMAILMLFEMTLSYQVMLPLMVGCVMAYFVARAANAGSMYDITLRRLAQSDERQRLRKQLVRNLIQPADTIVQLDSDLVTMSQLFAAHPVKYLYVVDTNGLYQGVVPLRSLSAATVNHDLQGISASDLLSQEIRPLTSDMELEIAFRRFMEHQGERLPVIQSADFPLLVGVVKKSAILETYAHLSV